MRIFNQHKVHNQQSSKEISQMTNIADKLDFLAVYKTKEGIRIFISKTFLIEITLKFRSTSPINKFNVSNYSILIALSLLKRDVIDLQLCQNKE